VHQVGNQPRLYYDARSTNHLDVFVLLNTPHKISQTVGIRNTY